MSRADDLLIAALRSLPEKATQDAGRKKKRRYSEQMSQVIAAALADELRQRGLEKARPGGVGEVDGKTGAERRMSGGIGAKKVDVTWATEESGLLLAISVKCITAKDPTTGNFQKNLINRRGDMLGEAVTLHRRFPYSVLGGFMFLDKGAADDATGKRQSTFRNAHRALRLFTGRNDPAGRDEQYERLYLGLIEASPFACSYSFSVAGKPDAEVSLDDAIDDLLRITVERDPDFYALIGPNGEIDPAPGVSPLSLNRITTSGVLLKDKKAQPRPAAAEERAPYGAKPRQKKAAADASATPLLDEGGIVDEP